MKVSLYLQAEDMEGRQRVGGQTANKKGGEKPGAPRGV